MRMRQLGRGQSVLFVLTPEVLRSITNLLGKELDDIDSADILRWSLEQTCLWTERCQPLWVMHGLRNRRQQLALQELEAEGSKALEEAHTPHITKLIDKVQEDDMRSLQTLYGPKQPGSQFKHLEVTATESEDPLIKELLLISKNIPSSVVDVSSVEEEQEREVAQEIEREREV